MKWRTNRREIVIKIGDEQPRGFRNRCGLRCESLLLREADQWFGLKCDSHLLCEAKVVNLPGLVVTTTLYLDHMAFVPLDLWHMQAQEKV